MQTVIKSSFSLICLCFSVLFTLCPCQKSEQKFSNLQRIGELKSKQIYQLSNPMKNALDEEILLYNLCIEIQQEKQQKFEILGPFYKFGVEGVDISLACSPCLPKGYPVSWSKITFENFQSEVKRTDGYSKDTDLVIKGPETDLSTYYCSWILENKTEIITNIWTVEVIPATNFEKVPARKWKNQEPFNEGTFTTQFHWDDQWSACNKCGRAGKRHRLGLCLVHANTNHQKPQTNYQALRIYSFLSCSLFLTFHPEMATIDEKVTQHLAETPKIMIGYCRIPCDYIDFDPSQKFEQSYPELLRKLYQNGSSVNGLTEDGNTHGQKTGQKSWAANTLDFVAGLKDIPITTDYIPEILAILSLFALQVYILLQVCRNRKKAI